jgi:hypothetical protein
MSGLFRRSLLALLCLLILSWGTCPCVIRKAFAKAPTATQSKEAAVVVLCPCCEHSAAEKRAAAEKAVEHQKQPGLPKECPCCARSGANRPLPPAQGDLDVLGPSGDFELWFPELPVAGWVVPTGEGGTCEATGPPGDPLLEDPFLHRCPVGIVRLLN